MALLMVPSLLGRVLITRVTGVELSPAMVPNFPAVTVLGIFGVLWFALTDAVMTRVAADAYLGRAVDVGGALRLGLRRFPAVLAALFLKYLLVVAVLMLGMVAATLVGIVGSMALKATGLPSDTAILVMTSVAMVLGAALMLPFIARYFAVPTATVLESLGPLASMRRSRTLAEGRLAHVLGAILLVWIIYAIPVGGVNLLVASFGQQWIAQIVGSALAVLVYPIVAAVYVALYYDLRIRKEGYDIELMSEQLAAGSAAVPAPPAPTAPGLV